MKYDLASLVRRTRKTRRREIVMRKIVVPATYATDLYASGYRDVVRAWQAAVEPVVAEYGRTLSELTQDSPEQTAAVISGVEQDIAALLVSVRLRLERWTVVIERWHRHRWRGAVLTATGIDLQTLVGPGDMRAPLSTAIERNVGLIRSVSDQTRARIGDAVFRGFQARRPASEVAKEIREAVAMSRRRALRIASHQTTVLGETLTEERRREAGISTWQWNHSGKVHYRPEHKARDGKRYDDDATSGAAKPPDDRPGQLPGCGCGSQAVLDLTGEF